ncbi:cyclin-dependent kinase inhibitor 3-like isoform X2 [Homarus americanus]|uniref:protein-tyrosine-phosphatase n=1 Tax=Homarus americanus TaxID=6706 RepID=A0A8J5JDZ7_HOMAM|nr:cyclin-dependent kinase inhibitor 3-like isoform X2 [Homarus americanus]KAG7153970.1 Cyclin-dependent kinase inhibitor 3-like [Homarus americanus]
MFDSSDSDDESSQASVQTLKVDWLDMSFMGCPQAVALSGLPGCRFRNVHQNLHMDLNKIEDLGISDVVMLVTKGELRKYRVSNLMNEYEMRGIRLHHYPFPDGTAPSIDNVMVVIDTVRQALEENRKILIHCMGGLGRACVIASCLLQYFENSLTPDQTIFLLRELRGTRAIQTVKQYNFVQDFRSLCEVWMDEDIERSVSR